MCLYFDLWLASLDIFLCFLAVAFHVLLKLCNKQEGLLIVWHHRILKYCLLLLLERIRRGKAFTVFWFSSTSLTGCFIFSSKGWWWLPIFFFGSEFCWLGMTFPWDQLLIFVLPANKVNNLLLLLFQECLNSSNHWFFLTCQHFSFS